ncbi:hypothetical protein [Pseudomonas sp. NPDC096950]|uniref:hypothetical protein n=1 Tax=Pseudomonas sp. NPDC096950 TaxID=3364485 RepID=UPI00383BB9EE
MEFEFACGNFRARTGVVVTAHHPQLGSLYWRYVSEASVGGPDFYGITADIKSAVLLEENWRTFAPRTGTQHDHVARVLREIDVDDDLACIDFLNQRAHQTVCEFRQWLSSAEWVDVAGPPCIEQCVDHGFFYEWENVAMGEPCLLPHFTRHGASRRHPFQIALSARLHWMEVRYLAVLGLADAQRRAKRKAFNAVFELATSEASGRGRYGTTIPRLFEDTVELAWFYPVIYEHCMALSKLSKAVQESPICLQKTEGDVLTAQ